MTDKIVKGGCYYGAVRHEAKGPVMVKGQCHCRECQYISGGGPNYFVLSGSDGFANTQGDPTGFARDDLEAPVAREFCPICGTHLIARLPDGARIVVKVGTMDDPAEDFGGPKLAIYTVDQQPFHLIPEDLLPFKTTPTRHE